MSVWYIPRNLFAILFRSWNYVDDAPWLQPSWWGLGIFLTTPLYAWHWITTQPWGLSPVEDQQLAGLLMWIVGGAIYLVAALRLAGNWLTERQRMAIA